MGFLTMADSNPSFILILGQPSWPKGVRVAENLKKNFFFPILIFLVYNNFLGGKNYLRTLFSYFGQKIFFYFIENAIVMLYMLHRVIEGADFKFSDNFHVGPTRGPQLAEKQTKHERDIKWALLGFLGVLISNIMIIFILDQIPWP